MKRIPALFLVAALATPVAAQDRDGEGISLMEEGARLFFRGLLSEMEPALKELERLTEEMGPALNEFAAEMGPALRDLLAEVEDWSLYEAPEMLPNGDIIIRRKPDQPGDPKEGEIEL